MLNSPVSETLIMLFVIVLYCTDVIFYIFALLEMCLHCDVSLDRYTYETTIIQSNNSESILPCLAPGSHSLKEDFTTAESKTGE